MNANAKKLADEYCTDCNVWINYVMADLNENPRGVIFSTPELFAILRPVCSHRPSTWEENFSRDYRNADAWCVLLLAGDLKKALRLAMQMLSPLPYIVFFRGKRSSKPHIVRWATFERYVKSHILK